MSECPCCSPPCTVSPLTISGNTMVHDATGPIFRLFAGRFTSTVSTSQDMSSVATTLSDVGWDGSDTYSYRPISSSTLRDLFRTSGQFSTTVKDSLDLEQSGQPLNGSGGNLRPIAWDGSNTMWPAQNLNKVGNQEWWYVTSGKFSTTIKTSLESPYPFEASGFSWDGTDTTTDSGAKWRLMSGQFTTTVKTSISSVSGSVDPCWSDGNYISLDQFPSNRFLWVSGQFSSTIKTSQADTVSTSPTLINTQETAYG